MEEEEDKDEEKYAFLHSAAVRISSPWRKKERKNEILTGLRAIDVRRPIGQQHLFELTKSSLYRKKKLKSIMDPRLQNKFPIKAAEHVAKIVLKCVQNDQNDRPSMEEVLQMLQRAPAIH